MEGTGRIRDGIYVVEFSTCPVFLKLDAGMAAVEAFEFVEVQISIWLCLQEEGMYFVDSGSLMFGRRCNVGPRSS